MGKKTEVKKEERNEASKAQDSAEQASSAYNPLTSIRDEMDRALGRMFSSDWFAAMPRLGRLAEMPMLSEDTRKALSSFGSIPRADLSEDAEKYELTVELPGMDEKDLELTLGEGMLTLKGEKKQEKETEGKDFHMTERSYGSVQRRFSLPAGVDADKLEASFSRGVLKVVLPKTPQARSQARKIEVKGG